MLLLLTLHLLLLLSGVSVKAKRAGDVASLHQVEPLTEFETVSDSALSTSSRSAASSSSSVAFASSSVSSPPSWKCSLFPVPASGFPQAGSRPNVLCAPVNTSTSPPCAAYPILMFLSDVQLIDPTNVMFNTQRLLESSLPLMVPELGTCGVVIQNVDGLCNSQQALFDEIIIVINAKNGYNLIGTIGGSCTNSIASEAYLGGLAQFSVSSPSFCHCAHSLRHLLSNRRRHFFFRWNTIRKTCNTLT